MVTTIKWGDHQDGIPTFLSFDTISPDQADTFRMVCQQFQYMHTILASGQAAPALEQARMKLISVMLQTLLPDQDPAMLAAIPLDDAEALLVSWCANQEALIKIQDG